MRRKILVVDDTKIMRTMLKSILMESGYEVAGEASNGEEAVRRYSELAPDAVMMDLTMPGISGVEAMKRIVAADPNAVVVMVTATTDQASKQEASQAGARSFITKPFHPQSVSTVLREVLGA